jgi:hypothetical protein
MKRSIQLAAITATMASLIFGSVNAAASPVVRQNFDITFTQVANDPCANYQPVAVTETLHFVLLVNSDNAGGFHVDSVVSVKNGTGVNLVTGATYVAGGANATAFEVKPPYPQVITNEATGVLVSTGSTPNLYTKILIHDTINADGTLTASVFEIQFSCNG